jgi:hypothetical protein
LLSASREVVYHESVSDGNSDDHGAAIAPVTPPPFALSFSAAYN